MCRYIQILIVSSIIIMVSCQDEENLIISNEKNLIINEINYNSSEVFDTKDWIEIYNKSDTIIYLRGYYFTDENPDHIYLFPENSFIGANDYIILAQDTTVFSTLFPNVVNLYGPFSFGLSGKGEEINLYDKFDNLIDRVEYKDSYPWPTEPDGNGPTLELINPDFANEIANAWGFSIENGTPGIINSVYSDSLLYIIRELSKNSY